eukprot:gene1465-1848_t
MSTLVFDHNNLFDLLNYNQNNNNNKSTPTTTKSNENKCKSEQQNPQQQPKSCKEQKSPQQQQKEYKFVYTPSIDVSETSESFIIDLEFPGVSKNDISINYNDSKLIVEGKKQKSIRLFNHNKNNNNKKEETFLEDKPTIEEINEDEFDSQSTTSSSSSSKSSVTSQQQQQQQHKHQETLESEKKAKEILNERRFGKLRRVIDLSSHINTIDIHSIKAQYNNGVLEITIPKKDAPKPIKITIN